MKRWANSLCGCCSCELHFWLIWDWLTKFSSQKRSIFILKIEKCHSEVMIISCDFTDVKCFSLNRPTTETNTNCPWVSDPYSGVWTQWELPGLRDCEWKEEGSFRGRFVTSDAARKLSTFILFHFHKHGEWWRDHIRVHTLTHWLESTHQTHTAVAGERWYRGTAHSWGTSQHMRDVNLEAPGILRKLMEKICVVMLPRVFSHDRFKATLRTTRFSIFTYYDSACLH